MARGIIGVLKDPGARPRVVLWGGVALIAFVILATLGVVGTSTNWFCTEPCHIVHLDNTKAFNAGSHVMVSCVACHEPVNGTPLDFILMKIEVLPDLIPTIAGTFELPMNEFSQISVEMSDEYCTRCHDLSTRKVNPSKGIIIDHSVHTQNGVTCTTCHNRVAHPEQNVEYTLEGDRKHENWMLMEACYRCHTLNGKSAFSKPAPGECAACHPPNFKLVPADHDAANWYTEFGDSAGHASAAKAETSRTAEILARYEEHKPEYGDHAAGPVLPPAASIGSCQTCHADQFCADCHGAPIPHPADFTQNHGDAGKNNPEACARCHAASEADAKSLTFCNNCHHSGAQPGVPWLEQHDDASRTTGAQACFQCHSPTYCATCHVSGRPGS